MTTLAPPEGFDNRLVAFLTARLDEEEQIASAAVEEAGADWTGHPGSNMITVDRHTGGGGIVAVVRSAGLNPGAVATFVGANDPARVCREIEVRRWTVESFQALMATALDPEADEVTRGSAGAGAGLMWLMLLAIADGIYSDHPEFDEGWRADGPGEQGDTPPPHSAEV